MFRSASGQAFHNPRKRICERDILPSVYIVTVRDRFGKICADQFDGFHGEHIADNIRRYIDITFRAVEECIKSLIGS